MKKLEKREVKKLITILIIIGVIILATILIKNKKGNASEEIAKCIGQKSILYTQLGCHACKNQEELFGESYKNLNVIDCWYEREKCANIQYTPTWIINEEEYVGVQTIEKLKELTNC
jgi:hypothetical protein